MLRVYVYFVISPLESITSLATRPLARVADHESGSSWFASVLRRRQRGLGWGKEGGGQAALAGGRDWGRGGLRRRLHGGRRGEGPMAGSGRLMGRRGRFLGC